MGEDYSIAERLGLRMTGQGLHSPVHEGGSELLFNLVETHDSNNLQMDLQTGTGTAAESLFTADESSLSLLSSDTLRVENNSTGQSAGLIEPDAQVSPRPTLRSAESDQGSAKRRKTLSNGGLSCEPMTRAEVLHKFQLKTLKLQHLDDFITFLNTVPKESREFKSVAKSDSVDWWHLFSRNSYVSLQTTFNKFHIFFTKNVLKALNSNQKFDKGTITDIFLDGESSNWEGYEAYFPTVFDNCIRGLHAAKLIDRAVYADIPPDVVNHIRFDGSGNLSLRKERASNKTKRSKLKGRQLSDNLSESDSEATSAPASTVEGLVDQPSRGSRSSNATISQRIFQRTIERTKNTVNAPSTPDEPPPDDSQHGDSNQHCHDSHGSGEGGQTGEGHAQGTQQGQSSGRITATDIFGEEDQGDAPNQNNAGEDCQNDAGEQSNNDGAADQTESHDTHQYVMSAQPPPLSALSDFDLQTNMDEYCRDFDRYPPFFREELNTSLRDAVEGLVGDYERKHQAHMTGIRLSYQRLDMQFSELKSRHSAVQLAVDAEETKLREVIARRMGIDTEISLYEAQCKSNNDAIEAQWKLIRTSTDELQQGSADLAESKRIHDEHRAALDADRVVNNETLQAIAQERAILVLQKEELEVSRSTLNQSMENAQATEARAKQAEESASALLAEARKTEAAMNTQRESFNQECAEREAASVAAMNTQREKCDKECAEREAASMAALRTAIDASRAVDARNAEKERLMEEQIQSRHAFVDGQITANSELHSTLCNREAELMQMNIAMNGYHSLLLDRVWKTLQLQAEKMNISLSTHAQVRELLGDLPPAPRSIVCNATNLLSTMLRSNEPCASGAAAGGGGGGAAAAAGGAAAAAGAADGGGGGAAGAAGGGGNCR